MTKRATRLFCSIIFAFGFFALSILSQGLWADDLTLKQKILMPGPLTQHHAEFEADCESCHTPFAKESLTQQCLDCHEDIASDRTSKTGFHGQFSAAASNNCETCHTDHEGRDFDITGLIRESFKHKFTRFPLEGAHGLLRCDTCHKDDLALRETPKNCFGCHREDDRHGGALGEECDQCHQATQWSALRPFDHDKTDFALHGAHQTVPCMTCHAGQQFTFNEQTCVACHRASDVHNGGNGDDCASCHTTSAWDQPDFDHDDTDFPLRGGHRELICSACHQGDAPRDETPQTCSSCHSNDDVHQGQNGDQCADCHNETSWAKTDFQHNRDTDFQLLGKHTQLTCNQCHTGQLQDEIPRDCEGCHRADDVHNNPDMKLCGTCHTPNGWQTISDFDHDLSQFPLLGMHRLVPCQSCHVGNQFKLSVSQCESCHANEDVHQGALGNQCESCHTPNSWALWEFDHDSATHFELTGKHQGLQCAACHRPGSQADKTSTTCGNCHQQQDIHNGEFGPHCEQCHTTGSFRELNIR